MSITQIQVRDLRFFGFHGAHEFERNEGNDFAIDISVWIEENARTSDRVTDTFDYSIFPDLIEGVNSSKNFHTLEHLAYTIGKKILEHSSVQFVRLNLRKLSAPMTGQFETIGIEMDLGSQPKQDFGVR